MSERRNVQLIGQTSRSIKTWTLVGFTVCFLGPLFGLAVGDVGAAILLEVIGVTVVMGSGIAAFWNHG